jgi:glucan phosphoethanolaminetransferase (alkaline phosphatase superfamily)
MGRAAYVVMLASLLASSSACTKRRDAGRVRNVVLIVVDTLRQDHLHAYGYERETAPTFSRLAREGVLWDGVSRRPGPSRRWPRS